MLYNLIPVLRILVPSNVASSCLNTVGKLFTTHLACNSVLVVAIVDSDTLVLNSESKYQPSNA